MRYISILMLYISVLEEFHTHMPKNKQIMSIDEFVARVEQNSINLAKSRAMTQSLLYEGKAMRAWNSSYFETELNRVKSPSGGTELESTLLLMLTPRLPWVSYTLSQSYQTKILKQEKDYI